MTTQGGVQYSKIAEIKGPLVIVDGVENAAFDELVEIETNEGEMVGDWEISLESNDPASDFTYNYDWYNYYQGSS